MSAEENTVNENTNNELNLWSENAGNGLKPIGSKVNFPAIDHAIMQLWEDRDVFQRTISEREGRPDFVAYDGPPGTNGLPHIGHMMQSALKDLWPRYYTMKGYRVLRKAGWDTHGLPVELTAEKELGLKCKQDILEYGLENYIKYCRETVFRYKAHWIDAIKRIGRFLDTDNDYATLTDEYIQTDWWALNQAWDKGLLYQGKRIMPHCPRCGTSLSSHETAQGYQDIQDISLFVKFRLLDQPDTFFVAWTTTAWTLLSNVALAVNPDLIYVTVETKSDRTVLGNETIHHTGASIRDVVDIEDQGQRYIFAEARLEAMKSMLGEYKIIDKRPGKELAGMKYQPLWDFLEGIEGAHFVTADDYVSADDGSGIVHLALYGEDDFRIIRENNVPQVQNVDLDGNISPKVTPFAGRWFREPGLDVDILKDLSKKGLLFGKLKIDHSYPHCYRCDTPLIYFAKSGWFLRTSSFKDAMMKANEDINWYPDHIKSGRFGKWLENNVDWNISRERYWGSPLPVWTCKDCQHQVCFGSFDELGQALGGLPEDFDPHKPGIDNIHLKCEKCGGQMDHETQILDPWFNAGLMPWGQWGYPAAEKSVETFDKQYPGDFICEAIDQTRGWFYTMVAISTMLTDVSSYKNVICTEHILDDEGHKMSKSRGNVVDAVKACDQFGADAIRWNFFNTNPWNVRRYKDDDVKETLKQVLIPYWNSYSFFVTYAIVDGWKPSYNSELSTKSLDRWILSRREWLRAEVEDAMDSFDVARSAGAITAFIDDLTNWYIRRSRRRFWKSEDDADKGAAYNTLYIVLRDLNRMLAPYVPFVSEAVYQNLERGFNTELTDSIHLADWPSAKPEWRDVALEERMEQTRKIVSLARALRNEGAKPVRQPLKKVVAAGLKQPLPDEYIDLIADELNVKSVEFITETKSLYTHHAKANFKVLGPRFGKGMKDIAAAIAGLSDDDIQPLVAGERISVSGESIAPEEITISVEAVEGFWVRGDAGITVAVDYRVDEDLISEWIAREFIHHVQNLRRENDLNVVERITVSVAGDAELLQAVETHKEYISNETLASTLNVTDKLPNVEQAKFGDYSGFVSINGKQT